MRTRNKRYLCASVALWFVFVFAPFAHLPYSYADEKRYNVPVDDSPVYGQANAPVTIIEFLDYQ